MMKFKSKYLYLIIFIVILSVVPYILISCGGGSYNSDQEIHDQKASYITFAIKRFLAYAMLTANRFAYSPKILIPNISLATPEGKAFYNVILFLFTRS